MAFHLVDRSDSYNNKNQQNLNLNIDDLVSDERLQEDRPAPVHSDLV